MDQKNCSYPKTINPTIINPTLPFQLAIVKMIIPNRIIVVITKELRVVPNLATRSPETIGTTVLHRVRDATSSEN
jgi:hypothetical protein